MAVLNHGMRETVPTTADPTFSDLLQRCWHTDPARRPSFLEVVCSWVVASSLGVGGLGTFHYGRWHPVPCLFLFVCVCEGVGVFMDWVGPFL
jgi:hypothetical protein